MKGGVLAIAKQVMHGGYVADLPTKKFVGRSAKNLKVNSRFDRIDCKTAFHPNNTSDTKAFVDLSGEYFIAIK